MSEYMAMAFQEVSSPIDFTDITQARAGWP